jgi:hypothetical protein
MRDPKYRIVTIIIVTICDGGVKTDDLKMMADELAKQILRASASTQYKDDYEKNKEHEVGKPLHVDYKIKEPYNSLMTEDELDEAQAECAGSSPGLDHIHYDFIKKMANRTEKLKLLEVYEQILLDGGHSNNYPKTRQRRETTRKLSTNIIDKLPV